MKICMVTLNNPLHHLDGVTISVNELSIALSKFGHEVWIIGFEKEVEKEEILEKDGVKYWCMPDKGSIPPIRYVHFIKEFSKRLEKLDRDEKIDVFHGHGGYAGPIALADLPKAKKVLTIHTTSEEDIFTLKDLYNSGLYFSYFKTLLFHPLLVLKLYRKWCYNKMDRIISVTKHNVDVAVKDLGLPRDKCVVIPNGVNYEKFQEIKTQLNAEEKENTLLYFGRLAPCKGIHILLHSIPVVLEEFPSIRVNIVGDGVYSKNLKKIARDLNIDDHINFEGTLLGDDLIKEILEAQIVIIPSLYEGQPLTLLEAMALGKPIIATRIPGICEVVKNGETGILIPPGDPNFLSHSIKALLRDPKLMECISTHAKTWSKNYSWDVIAEKIEQIYKKLIIEGNTHEGKKLGHAN